MHPFPRLAKLSRPQTAGLILRPRLFECLDRVCAHGAAWVYAPAGAGKTSLLSTWMEARERTAVWYRADEDDSDAATLVHYLGRLAAEHAPDAPPLPALTPEYLGGLATFARRFLRDLYARLPAPFVLVVDDVHLIGAESTAQLLLSVALSEVPPGSAVILCGRTAPPPALARFALYEGALTWEDLKLDATEAATLLARIDAARAWDVEALRTATQGWVAGLTLLRPRPLRYPQHRPHPRARGGRYPVHLLHPGSARPRRRLRACVPARHRSAFDLHAGARAGALRPRGCGSHPGDPAPQAILPHQALR